MQSGAVLLRENISNLLLHGLKDQNIWNQEYVEELARRMIDCQLPAVARRWKRMIELPLSPENITILRHELRTMLTLCDWLLRFDKLNQLSKLEVWQVAGASITKKEIQSRTPFLSHWLVKMVSFSKEDNLNIRKVWLYSPDYDRWCATLDYTFGRQEFLDTFTVGEILQAETYLYPGLWPWRIFVPQRHTASHFTNDKYKSYQNVLEIKQEIIHLLSVNPLLSEMPFHCDKMRVTMEKNQFYITDVDENRIPLHPDSNKSLYTFASSGGQSGSFSLLWSKDTFQIL